MPLTNGHNGRGDRDQRGRFIAGNAGGPGNPHARKVARWRKALCQAVTYDDMVEVVTLLVQQAKAGKQWAVCELLNRCLGRPQQAICLDMDAAEKNRVVEVMMFAGKGDHDDDSTDTPIPG